MMTPNEIALALHAEAEELGRMSHDPLISYEQRCLLSRAAGRVDSDVERMRRIVAHDCEPWFSDEVFNLKAGDDCPKCGGELHASRHRFDQDGGLPDCDWLSCLDCDFRTDPE